MCGIAGVVEYREGSQVPGHVLEAMGKVIEHRGPDQGSTFQDGPVGLVGRRLKIIDLSPAGSQPVPNEDGSIQLVYNGEMFNHEPLRRELEVLGHRFRGRCDSEVVVHAWMMSDVPEGVFLSGGLDSTAVLAFAREATSGPLPTFTLGYDDPSFSEWEYAREAARYYGTEHREIKIPPITPATIEEAVWHLDEPMTDLSAVPLYLLCREARRDVTVCLSGEGGDEVFVGYDRFIASKADRFYRLLPGWLRRGVIEPLAGGLRDHERKKGLRVVLRRFIEGARLDPEGGHMRWQYFGSPAIDSRSAIGASSNGIDTGWACSRWTGRSTRQFRGVPRPAPGRRRSISAARWRKSRRPSATRGTAGSPNGRSSFWRSPPCSIGRGRRTESKRCGRTVMCRTRRPST